MEEVTRKKSDGKTNFVVVYFEIICICHCEGYCGKTILMLFLASLYCRALCIINALYSILINVNRLYTSISIIQIPLYIEYNFIKTGISSRKELAKKQVNIKFALSI